MSGRGVIAVCTVGLAGLVGLYFWQAPVINFAWSEYLLTVQAFQRDLHRGLSDALRVIEAEGFGASSILVALSFFYGVFHAAGPGHGKIVISTYLLSHESQLRRGVILSFAAAMVQGVTAIVVVTSAVWLLNLSMRQTQGMANDVEVVSFALITLVGLLIIGTRLLRLRKSQLAVTATDHHHHKGAVCDHSHGPTADDLDAALSLRTFISIILSIGIRPCSGAVIVLLLAYSLNLWVAGLFAVLAMSLGTALTITLLAVLSIYLGQAARRFLTLLPNSSEASARIMDVIGLVGGGAIFIFGLLLLNAALLTPAHPFR